MVDYFGEGKFVYLGDSREFVNKLIEEMKKEIVNAEKNPGAE